MQHEPWMISHSIEVEIPFHDVDMMAVAWHGHYVRYIELARCALLERIEAPRSAAAPAPAAPAAPVNGEAERWLERLCSDGDDALEALVSERPDADRQQLRQRMRELTRARVSQHAPSIGRAELRLREALGVLLG